MVDLLVDDGIAKRSHRQAIFKDHFVEIGVGVAEHPSEGKVCVIDYGAQIIPHAQYNQMVEESKLEQELALKGEDTSNVDWVQLSQKVFEEINKIRKNPKCYLKQLERSLHSLDSK